MSDHQNMPAFPIDEGEGRIFNVVDLRNALSHMIDQGMGDMTVRIGHETPSDGPVFEVIRSMGIMLSEFEINAHDTQRRDCVYLSPYAGFAEAFRARTTFKHDDQD